MTEEFKHQHTPEAIEAYEKAKQMLYDIEAKIYEYNSFVYHEMYHLGYNLPCLIGHECWIPGGGEPEIVDPVHKLHTLFDVPPKSKNERRRSYLATLTRPKLLKALGEESCWTCVYCGLSGTPDNGPDGRVWHIDHAYPKALGGDEDPDNKILACATCNISKGKKTALEVLRRIFDATTEGAPRG